MSEKRLNNVQSYFEEITKKSYLQFMNSEVTFLNIYSMASGLFHISEWVCHHDLSKIQNKFGNQIKKSSDLWHLIVENKIPDSGFIRDLNNSAKHVILTFDPKKKHKNPSTGMRFAANTSITITGWGSGGFGIGSFGGSSEVTMDGGDRVVLLEPIATSVFNFWQQLINEFYPIK